MRERDGFPPGVPSWIDTAQPDPRAAAAFYGGLFGWTFANRMPAGAEPEYLVGTLGGRDVGAIALLPAGSTFAPGWNTYIGVESVEDAAESVRAAGGRLVSDPFDVGDLGRVAFAADPEGASFGLWQPRSITGAQSVNAPGTWNFSQLRTRDLDGAKRFYGAAFGWEMDEVTMGALAGTMVRLPGYADFLEQFDPGIRQRHADFGAPPGFSECIAWFLPLDDGGAAPHWSITFAVADADEVVARAQALGGTIVVEPFDVPPTRSAVLRDPAGAELTVSAFNPG